MTILLFLLGVLIAIGIARYNESDSLFWKLFVSLAGTYFACIAVHHYLNDDKKDKIEVVSIAPTQALPAAKTNVFTFAQLSKAVTKGDSNPAPVSKDTLLKRTDSIQSKVSGDSRAQPTIMFDTS